MAPVGEEAEEDDAMDVDLPPTRYDTAVRERELASQKIRIVSEMAASERLHEVPTRPSPRKQPLGPATTIPVPRSNPAPTEYKASKGKASEAPSRQPEAPGLFESVGLVLSDAFAASETEDGYRSPSEREKSR
jgi:hypothetical protein